MGKIFIIFIIATDLVFAKAPGPAKTLQFINGDWVYATAGKPGNSTNADGSANAKNSIFGANNGNNSNANSSSNSNKNNLLTNAIKPPSSSGAMDAGDGSGPSGGGSDGVGGRGGEPPGGGGGGSGRPNPVKTKFWIPYCFVIDASMKPNVASAAVKQMVDSYGKCDIALEPYVFRAKSIPSDAEEIVKKSKTVCPLNKVFSVEGSAVQVLSPHPKTADDMCKTYQIVDGVKKYKGETLGCSEVGNKGGSSQKDQDRMKTMTENMGGYSGFGKSGEPASSIVDVEAWNDPGVWCHESGHSVGGPKEGGDFLVNEGDGKPQPQPNGGMGLEYQGKGDPAASYFWLDDFENLIQASNNAKFNDKQQCKFTEDGCRALRGGANPNTKGRVWDPNQQVYYNDNMEARYDFVKGESFFGRIDPPNIKGEPPGKGKPPSGDRGELVFNDEAKGGAPESKPPGGGHDIKPDAQKGSNVADRLVNNLRNSGITELKSKPPKPNLANDPNKPKDPGGLVFDDNAKKADDSDNGSGASGGPGGSSGTRGGGSRGGGSSNDNGLAFDDSVAKGTLDNEFFSPADGASGSRGSGASGSGAGLGIKGAKGKGSDLDADFFNKIAEKEKKKNRSNRNTKLTSRPAPPGRTITSVPGVTKKARGKASAPPTPPAR